MISLISAMDLNRAIGKDNQLLTHLPNDLKRFKSLTKGNTIVMGRRTYESLPTKPLPNRMNIVLTQDENFKAEGCLVFHSIDYLLLSLSEDEEVFVIGGESIYTQFLPYADKLHLTIIDHKFDEVDTYFPAISDKWKVINQVENKKDEKHEYDFHYVDYIKIN